MSIDERLAQAARRVADGIVPPDVDLDAVRARARRNQRRTTAVAVAATFAAVATVGALVLGGRPQAAPGPADPVPSPKPAEVTPWAPEAVSPEQVVLDEGATLEAVGVAVTDPEVRLAVWSHGPYTGLAVTRDGFRTTAYAAAPFGAAARVTSAGSDEFLVQVGNASSEWLVGTDGTVRRVTRVDRARMPTDPRLWFQCEGGWRATWCALDPDAARAFRWPGSWAGSAVPPGAGAVPWGANPEPRSVGSTGRLEAWWGSGSGQRIRTLATADDGDYVLGCGGRLMVFWSRSGAGAVVIHTSRDGGRTWASVEHAFTGSGHSQVQCTARGDFLVLSDKAVWRADASGGPFREVFRTDAALQAPDGSIPLQRHGDTLVLTGARVAAISEDDGRTWTRITTWRGAGEP